MKIHYIHSLDNLDIKKIKKYQDLLKKNININNKVDMNKINICAGVDVAYWEKNNKTYGACSIVLIDFKTHKTLNKYFFHEEVTPNYIAGCLSIKELPIIIKTASKIPNHLTPDLFVFDGNGILHPKNMGIATHASFFLNKPTIGVAKNYFKINNTNYTEPKNKEFAYTEIKIKNNTKGVAFRSHKNTSPIFISPGNFIDLNSSIECIKSLIDSESRIPIATRYADIETHRLRKIYSK